MTRPEILMLYPQRPHAMAVLERDYIVHRYDLAENRDTLLAEVGARCEAIVTNGHAALDRALIERLPALRLVACSSAGYESFDVDALTKRGIALTNTSGALRDDVADMALLLLLAARRDLVRAHGYVASGDWGREGMYPLQSSLAGKRVGIVGMGHIGQAVARRCAALGLRIGYFGRAAKPGLGDWRFEADLAALARDSDILVVCIAGGPQTRHLIDAGVIEALGPQGTLINVARGSVVDEGALIGALRDGRLGSAGLDVYENEPHPAMALTTLPNVTLYPHHASGTVETRDAMAQLVLDNLAAHYAGRPLLTQVNRVEERA